LDRKCKGRRWEKLEPACFLSAFNAKAGQEGRNDIPGSADTGRSVSRPQVPDKRSLGVAVSRRRFQRPESPQFHEPRTIVEFGPFFLQSLEMLNQGLGGLNPLFQEGGPRSLQLSLKLTF